MRVIAKYIIVVLYLILVITVSSCRIWSYKDPSVEVWVGEIGGSEINILEYIAEPNSVRFWLEGYKTEKAKPTLAEVLYPYYR